MLAGSKTTTDTKGNFGHVHRIVHINQKRPIAEFQIYTMIVRLEVKLQDLSEQEARLGEMWRTVALVGLGGV